MKTTRCVRTAAVALAALGMCLPQVALAAAPAEPQFVVGDVALGEGGTLQGQVVNVQNAGMAGVPVTVRAQDRTVATATTGSDGAFQIQGLRGGVYELAAANGRGVYRLWSAGTAPPIAQPSATIYSEDRPVSKDVVVYTQGGWAPKMLLTNPLVIGAIVATAIAVPIALSNTSHASP